VQATAISNRAICSDAGTRVGEDESEVGLGSTMPRPPRLATGIEDVQLVANLGDGQIVEQPDGPGKGSWSDVRPGTDDAAPARHVDVELARDDPNRDEPGERICHESAFP